MPNKSSSRTKKPQEMRDLDLEIAFLEGILKREPAFVEALQILGDDYTRRGRFEEGLKIDEDLRRRRPEDPLVHYNLACSYSLTSQTDLAIESLETAIRLGYRDFKWLARDPDLKNLRRHAKYKAIRALLRQLQSQSR